MTLSTVSPDSRVKPEFLSKQVDLTSPFRAFWTRCRALIASAREAKEPICNPVTESRDTLAAIFPTPEPSTPNHYISNLQIPPPAPPTGPQGVSGQSILAPIFAVAVTGDARQPPPNHVWMPPYGWVASGEQHNYNFVSGANYQHTYRRKPRLYPEPLDTTLTNLPL